jgi:hypothetical protein
MPRIVVNTFTIINPLHLSGQKSLDYITENNICLIEYLTPEYTLDLKLNIITISSFLPF